MSDLQQQVNEIKQVVANVSETVLLSSAAVLELTNVVEQIEQLEHDKSSLRISNDVLGDIVAKVQVNIALLQHQYRREVKINDELKARCNDFSEQIADLYESRGELRARCDITENRLDEIMTAAQHRYGGISPSEKQMDSPIYWIVVKSFEEDNILRIEFLSCKDGNKLSNI